MNTFAVGRYSLFRKPLRLQDGNRTVRLTTRQLQLLLALARAKGETVRREDLLKAVWGDTCIEEANLTQTVFLLRRTLGKTTSGEELIETVPKIGYRLAAGACCSSETTHAADGDVHSEHQLKASAFRHLDALVDSIADFGIYMLDPAGRVRTWNTGAENAKGYHAAEIVGKHYSTFFTPEDVEAGTPERLLKQAVRNGRVIGEGWRLRKNGQRFWASFTLTAIKNQAGRLIGFGKAVHDITEHKLREDALQRAEMIARQERDSFLALAESSMDAIFMCSAIRAPEGEIVDFTFTFLNENVAAMVRIPKEILLGGCMCELLPANRALGLFEQYREVVNTGKAFEASFRIDVEAVASEWIRLRAVRFGDGVVITASDISHEKQLEGEVEAIRKVHNGQ